MPCSDPTSQVDDAKFPDRAERRTGVPLYDPTWGVQHERVKKINGDLARVIAQSPLEYRQVIWVH